jgi:Ulp1 family protease
MKPFSDKTIEAAKKMGLNMSAIENILESEDIHKAVKLKYNSDYIIRDLIRLNNGVWLNDEIINFNMMRIKEEVNKGTNKGIHIFSSFFIGKLYRDEKEYNYPNVERLS